MKRHHGLLDGAMAASVLVAAFCAVGVAEVTISDEARRFGERWLLTNCDTAEGKRFESELIRFRTELEPYFLEAVSEGPADKLVAEVERSAVKRFGEREEALKAGNAGLSEADRAIAQKVTREQFVTQEKQDFVTRYESQAIAGLGFVGGDKAEARLRDIAKDGKSRLQGSAEAALKRLQTARKSGK